MSIHVAHPQWLPPHIQELDGLRGLAVLAVFFFHARGRAIGTCLFAPFSMGWAGVNLFFVLSGYLITSILLTTREREPRRYYTSFYGRRALRILPLYILLITLCFAGPQWLLMPELLNAPPWKVLLSMALFCQNLTRARLIGAIGPTWSLAIEEQYYFLWAPIIKTVRNTWLLAAGLICVIAASPFARMHWSGQLNSMHTVFHLDYIAFGSLLAIGLAVCKWRRGVWLALGSASAVIGFGALSFLSGTALQDLTVGLGFTGVVLSALAVSIRPNPISLFLRRGPLPFFGKISYGLYLCHIPVMMGLGILYTFVDRTTGGNIWWINLMIIAVQFAVSTAVATLLWTFLETPILKFKRYF